MKLKKVWLLAGPPGAGKSTFIKQHLVKDNKKDIWISRDKIRFSLLEEGEDYFAHEDEVFSIFTTAINSALKAPDIENIYIDATHLNHSSRTKTRSHITEWKYIDEYNIILFRVPESVCQERNAMRTGRELVPAEALHNMYKRYTMPKWENYHRIFTVNENNEMEEVNDLSLF